MMKFILYTLGIHMVAGAISDPTQLCNELMTLDCKVTYIKGEKDETVCGTNGVTYDNLDKTGKRMSKGKVYLAEKGRSSSSRTLYFSCYYGQARCNDKNIAVATVGSCGTATTGTTPLPTTATATSVATGPVVTTMPTTTTTAAPTPDPILEAFCGNKNAIVCGTELSPICGSDKQFYLNKCEYSKAYCDDKTLTSQPIDFCTGAAGRK